MSNNIPQFFYKQNVFNISGFSSTTFSIIVELQSSPTSPNQLAQIGKHHSQFSLEPFQILKYENSREAPFQFQHNQLCNDEKDVKTMNKAKTIFHIFCSCWLLFRVAIEKYIIGLSKWLGFQHFYYMQWGGHTILVSVSSLFILQCSLILNIHILYRDGAHQVAPTIQKQDDLFFRKQQWTI